MARTIYLQDDVSIGGRRDGGRRRGRGTDGREDRRSRSGRHGLSSVEVQAISIGHGLAPSS
jgi:hypothetical protein